MLNRICGDMHLFKKMAAFFLAQQNEGVPLKAAARRPNRPTTKVEKHVGSQPVPAWPMVSDGDVKSRDSGGEYKFSFIFSVATGRKGTKSREICAKDPWKTNEYPPENWGKFQFDEFSFWNGPFYRDMWATKTALFPLYCLFNSILPGSLSWLSYWLSIITIYSCVVFLPPIYPKQPKGISDIALKRWVPLF